MKRIEPPANPGKNRFIKNRHHLRLLRKEEVCMKPPYKLNLVRYNGMRVRVFFNRAIITFMNAHQLQKKYSVRKTVLLIILSSALNSLTMKYDPRVEYKSHRVEDSITYIACTVCFGPELSDRYEGEVWFNSIKNKYGGVYQNNGYKFSEWSHQVLTKDRAQKFYDSLSTLMREKKAE